MERLWENGLPLWKVYGDPYKLASHSLPFFDLSHSANKAAATAHAPKNIAIISMSIQKLASHLLPGLEYNQINMPIPITAHIPNIIINPIISPQNFKSNKCEDAGNQYA